MREYRTTNIHKNFEKRSFEIYDMENKNFSTEIYKVYGYRRTLKKVGSYIYYAYLEPKNMKTLFIDKIQLINNSPYFQTVKRLNYNIEFTTYQSMISCDFTEDNKYMLCAYFNQNNKFSIIIFNSELEYINKKEFEYCSNDLEDAFIKIIYFKDNSKFIIMYTINKFTVRIRFVNYINNQLNNLFSPMFNNSEYLELNDTQENNHDGLNDMIKFDSNKIIKIYTGANEIILTVFQFYEDDTVLSIKYYNLFNYKEHNSINQPRLAVFRNTLVICVSSFFVNFNNKYMAGYFFLNYPMSKDVELTNNKIIIKDLISLENKIFSLSLKFKILDIPKDLILENKLSYEVKKDDIYEIDDELKLIQYRINEENYILKYEGIAIGNDQGYYSLKMYPKNINIKNSSDVYIEGRHGAITIKFNDCLEGYYHLVNDSNLCTNIKPNGYYIDEKTKTYKKCESPCVECYGSKISDISMNCITCEEGYYITEDTHSCYKEEIDNYYLDIDNKIYKRCHENCKRCYSASKDDNNMACKNCKDGYFYKADTLNCILPKNFIKRQNIRLTILKDYNFYIFMSIFIISILISFIIFLCFFNKKNKENEIDLSQSQIEMKSKNDNEKEENELSIN